MKELRQDVTARVCKAMRALLGWDQTTLSKKANIGVATVQNVERENTERETHTGTITSIKVAFEENNARVSFNEETGEVTIIYKVEGY